MQRLKRVWECDHKGPKYKGNGRLEQVDLGCFFELQPLCLCTGEPIPMKPVKQEIYNPDGVLH